MTRWSARRRSTGLRTILRPITAPASAGGGRLGRGFDPGPGAAPVRPRGQEPAGSGPAPPPSPDAAVMAAREAARSAQRPRRTARHPRPLRGLRPARDRDAARLRRRQSAARVMFVGEAPGARRGHRGPAVRRPLGQAARPHAGGDRARPHVGLYRQHRALAAAGQPHADAAGNRNLPAVHPAPDRARRSRRAGLPGRPSAQTLLGVKDGIIKTRGRWFPYSTGTREIRAMPTLHPAYLLRQPLQSGSPGAISWRSSAHWRSDARSELSADGSDKIAQDATVKLPFNRR